MNKIPFENQPSLTSVEKRAEKKLKSNWDYVIRTTPGVRDDFEQKYPELSKQVGEKISEDTKDPSNLFRPGIPDFLVFDETAEYKFIEVKGEGDGLRHSQLRWIRDFQGLNVEIWFAESNDRIERMDANEIEAYSFKKAMDKGSSEVKFKKNSFVVEMPQTLASIMSLEDGDTVSWDILDQSRLILKPD